MSDAITIRGHLEEKGNQLGEANTHWTEVMDELAFHGSFLLGFALGHRPPGPRSEALQEAVTAFEKARNEANRVTARARYGDGSE